MEFYDVHFSYIDQQTKGERFISVPEQGGGKLIPDSPMNPGVLHTIGTGSGGHLGLYRLGTQITAGNGKFTVSGLGSNTSAKDGLRVAFDCGAKRVLLPMSSVTDIPTIPGELFVEFQASFYSDPVGAVFKAPGVD